MTRIIATCLSLTCVAASAVAEPTSRNTNANPVVASRPVSAVKARPRYLLQYRFQTNQTLSYLEKQKSTITVTKPEHIQVTRSQTTTRKHFTVISAQQDGSAILEPVIDHVSMSAQFDDHAPRTYDSRKDKTPPEGYQGIAKTVGRALVRIKVDSDGTLISTVLLLSRNLQRKVAPAVGPKKPANDPSKNFLVVFPKKPIAIGDSWSDQMLKPRLRIDRGGRGLYQVFPIIRTYKLVSVKGDLATIQLESVSLKPLYNTVLQVQAAQLLPSATIQFDIKRGLIVSRTTRTSSKVHGGAGSGSLVNVVSHRVETLMPNDVASTETETSRN